ncbi:MAG: AAA family ATPase, partial [SAR324 cluster bacterium]|nr:AAA family ATPase [SAR324 cluster bacterium]
MLGKDLKERYRLEQLLGQNELGALHLATDRASEEMLAVKLFPPEVSLHGENGLRYQRAMRLLQGRNHPNLLVPIETGVADGRAYQVLPYYPALSLADALAENPFSESEGLELIRQIAAGLAALHEAGLPHLNLHAHNVLVSREGEGLEVVVTDPARHLLSAPRFPRGGITAAAYRAPEEIPWLGSTPDGRADLYALGVLGFLVLTGRLPFSGLTVKQLLHLHLSEKPPPPREWNDQLSPRTAAILLKLLAKHPIERFQSAEEVMSALAAPEPGARPIRPRAQRTIPADAPLLERGVGGQAFSSALARAATGRGTLFLLSGEAGLGKRSLFESFARQAEVGDSLVLRATGAEGDWCAPFQVPLTLLDDLCRRWKFVPQTRRRHLLQRLGAALEGNQGILRRLHPELAALGLPGDKAVEFPPQRERFRTLHALREVFTALAEPRHPLVMWLDNLEWADPDSLAWLRSLQTGLAETAMVVVGGLTPGGNGADRALERWLATVAEAPGIHRIELPLLEPSALDMLTRYRLGFHRGHSPGPEDEALCQRLTAWFNRRWGGNPLAHRLTLAMLMARGHLGPAGEDSPAEWQCDWRELDALGLPETLDGLIRAWLNELPQELQPLLEAAAAFPGSFALDDLAPLAEPLPREEVLERVERAVERQILRRAPAGLEFVHPKIKAHFFRRAPEGRRAAHHRLIGATLEAGSPAPPLLRHHLAARHFGHGGDRSRFKEQGIAAAEAALAVHASHGAGAWYQTVIPQLGNDPRLPQLLIALARCRVQQGQAPQALETLHQARNFDLPERHQIEILNLSAWAEAERGEAEAALALLEEALTLAGETLPATQVGVALTRFAAGATRKYLGFRSVAGGPSPGPLTEEETRIAGLLEQTAIIAAETPAGRPAVADEKLLGLAAARLASPILVRSLIRLGESQGDPDGAYFAEARKLIKENDFAHERAELHRALGSCLLNLLELRKARDALFMAVEEFKRLGDPVGEAAALQGLLEVERMQGPAEGLSQHAARLGELASAAELEPERWWADGAKAFAAALTGRTPPAEAGEALRELTEKAERGGFRRLAAYGSCLARSISLEPGNDPRIETVMAPAAEIGGRGGIWEFLGDAALAEELLLRAANQPEEREWHLRHARRLLEGIHRGEKRYPRLTVETTLLETLSSLAEGEPDSAMEQAEAGARLLEGQGARLSLGWLAFRLAEGLKRHARKDWQRWGTMAAALFDGAGATHLAEAARRALERGEGVVAISTVQEMAQETTQDRISGQAPPEARFLGQIEGFLYRLREGPESFHRSLLRYFLEALGAEYGALFLPDGQGALAAAQKLASGEEMPEMNRWLVETVWREGNGQLLPRFQVQPGQGDGGEPTAAPQSALAMPLGGDREKFGVVYLAAAAERKTYDEADLQRLAGMARQAGLLLSLRQTLREGESEQGRLRQEVQQLLRLTDWSSEVVAAGEERAILAALLKAPGSPAGNFAALLFWQDDAGEKLLCGAVAYADGSEVEPATIAPLSLREGAFGAVEALRVGLPTALELPGAATAANGPGEQPLPASTGGVWLPLVGEEQPAGAVLLLTREPVQGGLLTAWGEWKGMLRIVHPALRKARRATLLSAEREELEQAHRALETANRRLQGFVP